VIRPHWDWLDPIHGVGYQWWSGLGMGLIAALYRLSLWVYPTRCAQLGCWRQARKATLAGVAFCERHYEEAVEEVADE
jgi:hypothetical protein